MRIALTAVFVLRCGGAPVADSCITKGATYLLHFVEDQTGTCGPIPDGIANIDQNGKPISSLSITCQSVTVDGCTIKKSACMASQNGATCTLSSDVTFSADGENGSGLETLSCSDASSSCTSTYAVTSTRK